MEKKDIRAIQKLIEGAIREHSFQTSPKIKSFEIYWTIYQIDDSQHLRPNIKFEYE